MTRTEADIEAALTAGPDMPIDIEATLRAVHRTAQHRRRRRVVLSSAATVLVVGVGVPAVVALHADHASDRTGPPIAEPTSAGVVPTTAAFTGSCTLEVLPLPAEIATLDENTVANIRVVDMDPSGRYTVGDNSDEGYLNLGDPFVIRWDGAVPQVLPVHGAVVAAGGVNSMGDVVGLSRDQASPAGYLPEGHAWLYSNGVLTDLPTPDGFVGAGAMAINDAGQIAGYAERADGTGVAVRWDADVAHTAHVLPSAGSWARGDAIASDGTVVGAVRDARPTDAQLWRGQPYAWAPNGTARALPLPAGETDGTPFQVRGDWVGGYTAHSAGVKVVGNVSKAEIGFTAVRWRLSSGDVSTVDTGGFASSIGLNSGGDVVTVRTVQPVSDPPVTLPVLLRGGRSYDLPVPAAPAGFPSLVQRGDPVAISEDATVIVGHLSAPVAGPPTPVVRWHC